MVRMEVKQCHAAGWFSIEFRPTFSSFRKIDFHLQKSDSLFGIKECVFDGGADCIHECHQGVELMVGARENEKNVIHETFSKVDQVEESQDYCVFFLVHEQIGIGGSHPGSPESTTDLVCMHVHEFEGAIFDDEIECYAHYMGWWAVCGQQVLVFFHEQNHYCYAFFVCNVSQLAFTCSKLTIERVGKGVKYVES